MKHFHWLLCVAKKSRHCQTWLERRSALNENLQRKQNWTAKSTNFEENAGKIKSVFVIGAALSAKKLGRCLENYRSWRNTLGKLVVTVNLEVPWSQRLSFHIIFFSFGNLRREALIEAPSREKKKASGRDRWESHFHAGSALDSCQRCHFLLTNHKGEWD